MMRMDLTRLQGNRRAQSQLSNIAELCEPGTQRLLPPFSSCTVGLTVGRLWVCAVIWYYKLRALRRMTSLLYYLPLLIFCQNFPGCLFVKSALTFTNACTYMLSHISTNGCAGPQIFRHWTTQQMVEPLHAFGFTLKSKRDINKTEFIQQNKQNRINNINST